VALTRSATLLLSRSLAAAAATLAALALCGACQKKEEKRKVRTEPWPAPVLSVSASTLQGERARFTLESGKVRIEVKLARARVEGSVQRLDGELELDLGHVDSTRGRVRADLLDLNFWPAGDSKSPDGTLTWQALRALELDADRAADERERDRWAELRVVGFEATPTYKSFASTFGKGATEIRALAELTLHRFRVPVTLELEVEPVSGADGALPSVRVRTRRPLVVSLAAHDVVAQRAPAAETAGRPGASEKDRVREARVSAELLFRLARQPPAAPSNP
jgi:hypothetical protein